MHLIINDKEQVEISLLNISFTDQIPIRYTYSKDKGIWFYMIWFMHGCVQYNFTNTFYLWSIYWSKYIIKIDKDYII